MCMHTCVLAWCLWRPEEGIRSPKTGVIQSCKFPRGWQEPKSGPLQEKQVPLTAKPSLQPPHTRGLYKSIANNVLRVWGELEWSGEKMTNALSWVGGMIPNTLEQWDKHDQQKLRVLNIQPLHTKKRDRYAKCPHLIIPYYL